MKYLLSILIFFSLSIFCYSQEFKITGIVTNNDNKKPIRGVKLELHNKKDSLVYTKYSDKRGYFIFTNLVSGDYYLIVEKKKYFKKEITDIKLYKLSEYSLNITLGKEINVGLVY